jgi:hypothetical protein
VRSVNANLEYTVQQDSAVYYRGKTSAHTIKENHISRHFKIVLMRIFIPTKEGKYNGENYIMSYIISHFFANFFPSIC